MIMLVKVVKLEFVLVLSSFVSSGRMVIVVVVGGICDS